MKTKKKTTIKKTILNVWDSLPEQFGSYTLCLWVQNEMKKEQNYAMSGTILRRLRELREVGKCVYTTKGTIYKKVEV